MERKEIIDIIVLSIQMEPPIQLADGSFKRQSKSESEKIQSIVSLESFLRKTAYKNTTIKTNEFFFDDSDMKSEYSLVVVYDKISNTPLLSARHYFDKNIISKYLRGDNDQDVELSYLGEKFNLDLFHDGIVFLADRLSGNISSSIYRNYRSNIFSLYYSEIINNNKNCKLLLMVRKEKYDKQLFKYLKMGFVVIGSILHKGKEHTIILHDLKNV
jgi:hypothetical protein